MRCRDVTSLIMLAVVSGRTSLTFRITKLLPEQQHVACPEVHPEGILGLCFGGILSGGSKGAQGGRPLYGGRPPAGVLFTEVAAEPHEHGLLIGFESLDFE